MQPLRVGVFTEVYHPVRNGIVASVAMLEHELRERGHQVICVTPMMPGYRDEGSNVVRLPSWPLPTRTAYRFTLPFLSKANARVLQDSNILHAHSPFITGWMAVRLARRLRIPLVFTYHTQLEHYTHYVPFEPATTRHAVSGLTRIYANAADAVIVPTTAMETHLRKLGVRTTIEVIASGIDVAHFSAGSVRADVRARLGAIDGGALVVCVGRLGREKNLELALEAFARAGGNARLAIIGDGVERAPLEQLAQRLAPGRVRFVGEQSREALPDIYASADALLFTSTSETQGLVLVEALAAGLAVVAIDTPQGRDVLSDAAWLCAPDPQAIAEGLAAALASEGRLREHGRAVAARFDGAAAADRVSSVYQSVLRRRSLRPAVGTR